MTFSFLYHQRIHRRYIFTSLLHKSKTNSHVSSLTQHYDSVLINKNNDCNTNTNKRIFSSQSSSISSTTHGNTNSNSNNGGSNGGNSKPIRTLSSLPDLLEVEDDHYHRHQEQPKHNDDSMFLLIKNDNDDEVYHHDELCSYSGSPSHLSYVEGVTYPITSELRIVKPSDDAPTGIWPVFRVMDEDGTFRSNDNDGYSWSKQDDQDTSYPTSSLFVNDVENQCDILQFKNNLLNQYPNHTNTITSTNLFQTNEDNMYKSYAETASSVGESQLLSKQSKNCILLRVHRVMSRLRQMDDILLNAQRQGRISFYLTCRGEEGIHIGSASALTMADVVLAQYREQGILMWRGFTLDQFTNQCFTNDLDLGRGRQMPIHYGSRALNYHTISSPLGTQLPQAVGVAYKKKLERLQRCNTNHDTKNGESIDPLTGSISIVYFGDGAASTSDFHSAMNFAATLKVPMIFFCRNNGYAISTKITDQYASDGIVSRCRAYGMAGIRVDGNDVFAVNTATKAAREYAIRNSEPVLIEAISYRQGHHSTSDDSSQYRTVNEVQRSEDVFDPLRRFEEFLMQHKWMDENNLLLVANEEREAVVKAMEKSEKRPLPKLESMFKDVYKDMPLNLLIQEKSLQRHLSKYPIKK